MKAESLVTNKLANIKSPSRAFAQSRPFVLQAGSDEARLYALENDIAVLRDALILAAGEIDKLSARLDAIGK